MKMIAFAALATASLLAPLSAIASDPQNQLIGAWVLCQDPDNNPKDGLEFFPEGYGFSIRPNKPKAPFLFKMAQGQVLLVVNAKTTLITITLAISHDNSRLTLKSDRTGAESFYVRQGQESLNDCTAK